jgi:hypothetical protein
MDWFAAKTAAPPACQARKPVRTISGQYRNAR